MDENNLTDKIQAILNDLKQGKFILITDAHDRENEADLLSAAEFVTATQINFLLNHARGLITHPITQELATKLSLNLMNPKNLGTKETAFTISIDAKDDTTSGISSRDRATTILKLAESKTIASDFESPGHVFPLIAHPEGLKSRPGHTEASIELLKLAKLYPVGVLCETLNENGEVLRGEELLAFSKLHQIKIISIEEILSFIS